MSFVPLQTLRRESEAPPTPVMRTRSAKPMPPGRCAARWRMRRPRRRAGRVSASDIVSAGLTLAKGPAPGNTVTSGRARAIACTRTRRPW